MEAKLAKKGWNPTVRCWAGKGSDWGVQQVERARELKHLPNTVIVALGTNDVWFLEVPMDKAVDKVMTAIGPSKTVYWVNLWFGPNNYGLAPPTEANKILKQKKKEYKNLRIIDFASKYSKAIKKDSKNGWTDGVHLNAAGYVTRTQIILNGVGKPKKN